MTRANAAAKLITIQPHTPTTWLIKGPADINETMGRFQAARLVPGLGYIIADEHRTKFEWFAGYSNLQVTETHPPTPGPHTANPLPECRHCGKPARRDHQPAYCPECGHPWEPTTIATTPREWAPRQTCAQCGNVQRGNHRFCTACGNNQFLANPDKPMPARPPRQPSEPLPLGETLTQTLTDELPNPPPTSGNTP